LSKYYQIEGKHLSRQYKERLSGYRVWSQITHCEEWILYSQNIGEHLCLDEISLSGGELYTVLPNGSKRTQKGSLIAMIKGVRSEEVIKILSKIPLSRRLAVKEVSIDMANNMEKICRESFPNASIVTDRFHVSKLLSEAVQEMRIKYRWEAIEEENEAIFLAKQKGEQYSSQVFANGATRKQLLARSRYLLFKPSNKWSDSQRNRAELLFKEYPDIRKSYELSIMFRNIYEYSRNRTEAEANLSKWYEKVNEKNYLPFQTISKSIENHKETILNYFISKRTNALAETFNSKIKAFRLVFRGVSDIGFFLYRVSLIFA
jgi:transposase